MSLADHVNDGHTLEEWVEKYREYESDGCDTTPEEWDETGRFLLEQIGRSYYRQRSSGMVVEEERIHEPPVEQPPRYEGYEIEDASIDQENLAEEFARQPARYARFAHRSAEATSMAEQAKDDMERIYCEIDLRVRKELQLKGDKVTEGGIRSLVLTDEEYVKAQEQYYGYQSDMAHAKADERTWSQRADMLVSLGNLKRDEMKMTGMQMSMASNETGQATSQEGIQNVKNILRRR